MSTPAQHDAEAKPVTYMQHGWEKCKQQPMVPIGAAVTTAALLGASASLRSGNRASFQKFLRLRVAAQGVTVLAMVVGAYMLTEKAGEAEASRNRARIGVVPPDPPAAPEPAPEDEHAYPPRVKTKVSDFTRRVREAEHQQAADDAAARK